MYQAYGLLKPDSDFTIGEAAKRLSARLPTFGIAQARDQLILSTSDWEIHLTLKAGLEVLAEARTIEEGIGGAQDDLGINSCDRRVEVESNIPDSEMNHFNDYLTVIEVLKSFKGVIAVDPQEPSLL